ncbi:MAG: hypothetical protein AB7O98_18190 [Hyphomonadaceae bacterium]
MARSHADEAPRRSLWKRFHDFLEALDGPDAHEMQDIRIERLEREVRALQKALKSQ